MTLVYTDSFIQLGKGDSIWATLIDNELNWLVHLPAREKELQDPIKDKEQLKAYLLRQLTINHSVVRSIIEHTPAENISIPQGVYAQDQMNVDLKTQRVVYVHCNYLLYACSADLQLETPLEAE